MLCASSVCLRRLKHQVMGVLRPMVFWGVIAGGHAAGVAAGTEDAPAAVLGSQPQPGAKARIVSTTSPASKQTTRKGVAVVLDASASMCGFFAHDAAEDGAGNPPLLRLINQSLVLADRGPNKVFLLRQQLANTALSDAGLRQVFVPAPQNLGSVAQQITVASAVSPDQAENVVPSAACSPFVGGFSNLSLIFNPRSPLQAFDGMVLVSDAQMTEADKNSFTEGFSGWMKSLPADLGAGSAGFAVVQSPFAGNYFPAIDAQTKGYKLPLHHRPLFVFWFSKTREHLPWIESLVRALDTEGKGRTRFGVQQLLPNLAVGAQVDFSQADRRFDLPAVLEDTASYRFVKHDNKRSDKILSTCLKSQLSGAGVRVSVDPRCRDDRPLFDGVSEVEITFRSKSGLGFRPVFGLQPDTMAGAVPGVGLVTRWAAKSLNKNIRIFYKLVPAAGMDGMLDLKSMSIGADACLGMNGTAGSVKKCRDMLDGKTFRIDELLEKMVARQQRRFDELSHNSSRTSEQVFDFYFGEYNQIRR